jgi:hypothetical protein
LDEKRFCKLRCELNILESSNVLWKDTHPNTYAKLMTLMCNTRSNVFLQSMKNNSLSVKKLTKNLILRTLRQLYAVSEIIILIRWVTPPTIVEILQSWVFHHFANSSNFQIPQVCKFLNFSNSSNYETDVLHWLYIYIYIWVFNVLNSIHLLLILQVDFHLSECDRTRSPSMLNSTQSVHKFFICVLLWNIVQSLHCVLDSWRNCKRKFKTTRFWGLPL